MCIVSMVHDHYQPLIPGPMPWETSPLVPWQPNIVPFVPPPPAPNPEDVQRWLDLVAGFRKAKEAAEVVDRLTGQPDCVDPDKAKLEARVVELEKQLAMLTARRTRAKRPPKGKRRTVPKVLP